MCELHTRPTSPPSARTLHSNRATLTGAGAGRAPRSCDPRHTHSLEQPAGGAPSTHWGDCYQTGVYPTLHPPSSACHPYKVAFPDGKPGLHAAQNLGGRHPSGSLDHAQLAGGHSVQEALLGHLGCTYSRPAPGPVPEAQPAHLPTCWDWFFSLCGSLCTQCIGLPSAPWVAPRRRQLLCNSHQLCRTHNSSVTS